MCQGDRPQSSKLTLVPTAPWLCAHCSKQTHITSQQLFVSQANIQDQFYSRLHVAKTLHTATDCCMTFSQADIVGQSGWRGKCWKVHKLHLSSMTGRSHPFLATSLKLSVALSKADSILLICSSSSRSLSIQLQTGSHNPVS